MLYSTKIVSGQPLAVAVAFMDEQRFRIRQSPDGRAARDERRAALVRRIESACERKIIVHFHRNRWTYFSCNAERSGTVRVRLHEAFLDAPIPVIQAIGRLIRRESRQARRAISAYVDSQSRLWDPLAERPPRPLVVQPRGRVIDLQALFNDINRTHFDNQCAARITWGRGARNARNRRQITFGTYDESAKVIRIHPILDRRTVPEFFVRYIVYHEMLHALLPAAVSPRGRKLYHSRLFRQRERQFQDYARARAWSKRFVEKEI
jgi:hypothetical protein